MEDEDVVFCKIKKGKFLEVPKKDENASKKEEDKAKEDKNHA
jgi:hypothetical protein